MLITAAVQLLLQEVLTHDQMEVHILTENVVPFNVVGSSQIAIAVAMVLFLVLPLVLHLSFATMRNRVQVHMTMAGLVRVFPSARYWHFNWIS